MANIEEFYIDYAGFKTYCKVVGECAPGRKPLLFLHGGPGGAHDGLLTYEPMADRFGRQLVFYDQIGGGRSAVPHQPDEFYDYDLWIDEFFAVRDALGLDDFHVFGNSWGGMVGMMALLRDSSGVNSFVINSSPACNDTWVSEASRLVGYLPDDMQAAIARADETGDYDAPELEPAMGLYYRRHIIGAAPDDVAAHMMAAMSQPSEAYMIMQGPSEFVVTGKMRDWDIREELQGLRVPCMMLSGTDDECTPYTAKETVDCIPDCEWTLLQGAAHLTNLTHPEECIQAVEGFLERHE